ncbi:hypothetical protein PoB_002099500 [Plakobranchus ocellatus]|uniref:Uncharacterized protein n=1 Tax=Plakobranchus ocellatus TaxID=259542 RepID=A0AAV3ZFU5_9GAST|nr:hypothetical protein PoB_002099500 [Plakobranchus ocellatus]
MKEAMDSVGQDDWWAAAGVSQFHRQPATVARVCACLTREPASDTLFRSCVAKRLLVPSADVEFSEERRSSLHDIQAYAGTARHGSVPAIPDTSIQVPGIETLPAQEERHKTLRQVEEMERDGVWVWWRRTRRRRKGRWMRRRGGVRGER